MKLNMGVCDRLLRLLVVAPVATVVGVIVGPTSVASWMLYGVAAVMVATGASGFCPLYTLFGIDTRRRACGQAGCGWARLPLPR